MKGRGVVLALVAVLSLLCATAVAFAHDGDWRVPGTKGDDELTMGGENDRVYARAGDDVVDGGEGNDRLRGGRGDDTLLGGGGDDRLKGGQDSDYMDGGEGDDRINARGDGRDGDEVICGPGEDTVLLGRGDEVVDADGCEQVKLPRGKKGKKVEHEPCAARVANQCDDPSVETPEPDEPDEPVEEPEPDTTP
jgi:Ca2+-binding RTX toxin-like protein